MALPDCRTQPAASPRQRAPTQLCNLTCSPTEQGPLHSLRTQFPASLYYGIQMEIPPYQRAWPNNGAQPAAYLITKPSLWLHLTSKHSLVTPLDHTAQPGAPPKYGPLPAACLNVESNQMYQPVGKHRLQPHKPRKPISRAHFTAYLITEFNQ